MPGVLLLTFDDVPSYNSLTTDTFGEITRTLRDTKDDDTVKAIVFTGAGEKAFSSGLSMGALATLATDDDRALFYTGGLSAREAIYAVGKPVIAAVNGACAGGGFELALCCDLIYASEKAKFTLPEVNIALTPGCGGAINLAHKMPLNRVYEMIWFGERVTADELQRWGVVNAVFAPEVFREEVAKRVNTLLEKPQSAVRALKQVLSHTALYSGEAESLKYERTLAVDEMRTRDFTEGVTAFREKRTPKFNVE
jgi:enoyl-CoA hydratase/carnithine racemase